MARITYTVPADSDGVKAAVAHLVDIDLDDRALARLAVRAVRNLAGRAVSGPATARARKAATS